MKDKYIGHAASIYRTRHIYISDAQYLYIQRHRYIDAKRTGWNQTCLKLHCLLWIRTSNVIILSITCSRSQHYLLSGQSFFFSGFSFPRTPCSSAFRLKDTWNSHKVGSFSCNTDEQGARGKLKDLKEYFQIK